MTDNFDDLDRRLARLFAAGRREDPLEHPAPEKLSAYQANELLPEETDAIQEHLIQCTSCTDLLLDLERFLKPSEEELTWEGVSDLGTETGWRKIQAEIGAEGLSKESSAEVSRLRRNWRFFQAIAAVLLLGLSGRSIHLYGESEPLRPISLGTSLAEWGHGQAAR